MKPWEELTTTAVGNKHKIAARYMRVSSDDQKEKETIDTQDRLLAEYAKRENYTIYADYIDNRREVRQKGGCQTHDDAPRSVF